MFWWSYGGRGRVCLFGHKWVVQHLSKQSFEVTESCNWCGKRRVRALLPADEQKEREGAAYERGREVRLRFTREMKYQSASGNSARATQLRKQLEQSRQELMEEIRIEKRKRGLSNRAKISELRSELRGLLFGR